MYRMQHPSVRSRCHLFSFARWKLYRVMRLPTIRFIIDVNGTCNCDVGFYFTGSSCAPCLGNTYKDTVSLQSSCTSCNSLLLGTYAVSLVSSTKVSATTCGCPGLMMIGVNGTFVCGPGSFYSLQTSSCQPCATGTYFDSFQFSLSCLQCKYINLNTFSDNLGLINSFATSPLGSTTINNCTCPPTFVVDSNGLCSCDRDYFLSTFKLL